MLLTRTSIVSGKTRTMDLPITEHQLHAYNTGNSSLQKCFPQLTPDQREFIKSGITADEWDETMSSLPF